MAQALHTKRVQSVEEIVHPERPLPKASVARWSSPLLRLFFALLVFETLTGFAIFFLGRFLPFAEQTFQAHWIVGILMVPFSTLYLWSHYKRIKIFPKQLIYQLGVLSFYTLLMTTLTGIPLIWPNESNSWYQALDLMHLFFSSLFLIVLPTHLFVLLRRLLLRANSSLPDGSVATLAWYPLLFSTVVYALFLLFL